MVHLLTCRGAKCSFRVTIENLTVHVFLIVFQQYAMQQAMKTMMNQMNTQNNQFRNAAFSPGSPFPFPTPSPSGPGAPFSPATQPSVTVDVPATKVEAASATDVKNETEFKSETEVKEEPKKYGRNGVHAYL